MDGRWRDVARALVLILTGLPALADEPPAVTRAEYGPRVDLVAEKMALGEAVERIGRQLNRPFGGKLVETGASARQPYTFAIRDASALDALTALEDATGFYVLRQRDQYLLSTRSSYGGVVGTVVGDWVAWLYLVRYTYYSDVYPGQPDAGRTRAYLSPYVRLQAPSDLDSMRLLSVTAPRGLTPTGEVLEPTADQPTLVPQAPDLWQVTRAIEAPDTPVERLAELRFTMQFAPRLELLDFDFLLVDGTQEQLQTAGDYDARLRRVAHADAPALGESLAAPVWELELTGPVPAFVDEKQAEAVLRGRRWLEGRFHDADGRALFTSTDEAGRPEVDEGRWRSTWRFALTGPDTEAQPQRLAVRLALPVGEPVPVEVVLEDVMLPPQPGQP